MGRSRYGDRGPPGLTAVAGLLALAGLTLVTVGWRAQESPPRPAAQPESMTRLLISGRHLEEKAATLSRPPTPTGSRTRPASWEPMLARSTPIRLTIPAIGVRSDVLRLGLNRDRTVQVPPLTRSGQAGWYTHSAAPGQLGAAIVLGHIDAAGSGPGVFFRLGALRRGQIVTVTRVDRTTAVFRIDTVVEYSKAHFPTGTVYGPTDHAVLRLITCGGKFNWSSRSYDDNIVVYAHLFSSHPT